MAVRAIRGATQLEEDEAQLGLAGDEQDQGRVVRDGVHDDVALGRPDVDLLHLVAHQVVGDALADADEGGCYTADELFVDLRRDDRRDHEAVHVHDDGADDLRGAGTKPPQVLADTCDECAHGTSAC